MIFEFLLPQDIQLLTANFLQCNKAIAYSRYMEY